MLGTVVSLLDASLPATPVVVDLGAGTGALSAAILAGIPRARAILVDIDPAMLDAARERLAPYAARCEFRRTSFADAVPACDAVVASLALITCRSERQASALHRNPRRAPSRRCIL